MIVHPPKLNASSSSRRTDVAAYPNRAERELNRVCGHPPGVDAAPEEGPLQGTRAVHAAAAETCGLTDSEQPGNHLARGI